LNFRGLAPPNWIMARPQDATLKEGQVGQLGREFFGGGQNPREQISDIIHQMGPRNCICDMEVPHQSWIRDSRGKIVHSSMISQPLRDGTGTQSGAVVHKVQKYGGQRVHVLAVDPLIFSKETKLTIAKHRNTKAWKMTSICQARYFTSTRFISQSSTKPQPFNPQCVIKYVRNAAIQSTISSWAYKQGASKRTRPPDDQHHIIRKKRHPIF
jgi:hypothetical protein